MKILIEINQANARFRQDPKNTLRDIFKAVAESNIRGNVEGQGMEPEGGETIYYFKVLEHTLPDGTVRRP